MLIETLIMDVTYWIASSRSSLMDLFECLPVSLEEFANGGS